MLLHSDRSRRVALVLTVCCAALSTGTLSSPHQGRATWNGTLADPGHIYRAAYSSAGAETPPNYAGALEGIQHWSRFPLRVAFVSNGSLTLARENAMIDGFDQWVSATGSRVSFRLVSDPRRADVVVQCDPSLDHGVTSTSFDRGSERLSHADIHIGLAEPDRQGEVSTGDLQGLAAHEFGHALGINGHSPAPGDLMYAVVDANRNVTSRDLNTLRIAYP